MATVDWTEKYRPRSLDDVVGNGNARGELAGWARAWEDGVPEERAVILAGQPGVGKTSAAHALARDMGWGVIEMNASEKRNFDAVTRVATSGAMNRAFNEDGSFDQDGGRQLVILDEADNLFGNQDRGGMRAIIQTIREAQQPIVLIANDEYELKRKGSALRGLTKTIKFHKVHKRSIPKALRGILQEEGIGWESGVLEAIADRADGDLRGAVNDLQSLAAGRDEITMADLEVLSKRDRTEDIFSALKAIFYGSDVQEARSSVWDVDETPDHIELWVDENLPRIYKDPADLVDGFHALARADIYLGRTRSTQNYRMWSYANDMMTVGVSQAKTSKPKGARFQFPGWLKKMSRSRGVRNTRESIASKLGAYAHTSNRRARLDLFPALKQLMQADEAFAVEVAATLDLEKKEVRYLLEMKTKGTKTVARIVEEAQELREERAAPKAAPGAFARFDAGGAEASGDAVAPDESGSDDGGDEDGSGGDEGGQVSLTDF